jgi:hypothetical protein
MPAPLFDSVDASLSQHWKLGYFPDHSDHYALLSFHEWLSDPFFYDKLTDRSEEEARIFLKYKFAIDSETH